MNLLNKHGRTPFVPQLLAILGLAAGAAAEPRWPDYVGNEVVPYASSGLSHGPVLGRPGAKSMRVWVRTKRPMGFRIVFDTKLPLRTTPALNRDGTMTPASPMVDGKTEARRDNTGFTDLATLRPNTRYFYGVVLDGQLVDIRMEPRGPWPSFRTLPDKSSFADAKTNPKGRFNFSFAVAVGANQGPHTGHHVNPPAFATLFERHGRDVQFLIFNGDFIYEERRTRELSTFRKNYQLYLSRGRTVANFIRHVPTLFTYDDHETFSDLEGTGEIGLGKGKWLLRDPALSVWYEYCGWANFDASHRAPLRFGSALVKKGGDVLADAKADFTTLKPQQVSTIHVLSGKNAGVYALEEVLGKRRLRLRPAFKADDKAARYSIGTHHYFDWRVGNCHFFVLDTRGERTRYIPAKAHDPDRFILGATQLAWLMDGVRRSDAEFIFIVSSVGCVIYHTNFHVAKRPVKGRSPKEDGWPGAVVEREKMLNFLDEIEKPVLLLTGDLHNSFAVQITDNVWEFMTAPINSKGHPRATAGRPPFGGGFTSEGRRVKIKWMAGFPDDVHYSRLNSTVYAIVQVNNCFKSARPRGTGVRWVAYDSPQVVVQFYDGYTGKLLYAEGISKVDAEKRKR